MCVYVYSRVGYSKQYHLRSFSCVLLGICGFSNLGSGYLPKATTNFGELSRVSGETSSYFPTLASLENWHPREGGGRKCDLGIFTSSKNQIFSKARLKIYWGKKGVQELNRIEESNRYSNIITIEQVLKHNNSETVERCTYKELHERTESEGGSFKKNRIYRGFCLSSVC